MERKTPAVVALGMFDGVHIGHKALLERTVGEAERFCAVPAAYTFSNHPMETLGGSVRLLTDVYERNDLIRSLGIEELVSEPFTKETAALSPEAFVEMLLIRWDVCAMVVGYNYTFGERALGTPETLRLIGRRKGFSVVSVPPVVLHDAPVSSTRVRETIERGELELAAELLGRPYLLSGRIVQNRRIGRRIGFPTANIEPDEKRVLPPDGVYATNAYVHGAMYRAVTNVGANPTVHGDKRSVETYLIGFDADIYGAELQIGFRFRIRDEITFDSMDTLKAQIEKDVAAADKKR
jgi:riboflavin kinase/FMN adenylyltransferase